MTGKSWRDASDPHIENSNPLHRQFRANGRASEVRDWKTAIRSESETANSVEK